jgi:hypothetical protein
MAGLLRPYLSLLFFRYKLRWFPPSAEQITHRVRIMRDGLLDILAAMQSSNKTHMPTSCFYRARPQQLCDPQRIEEAATGR